MEVKEMNENVKLSIKERLSYGSGMGGANIFTALLSTFLLSYYTDTALINAAAIGTMFLITRAFDGISDIIAGILVDKTNTRFGKARPWILASAPLLAIGIALIFFVPAGWDEKGKLVYAYLTYIFANVIAYTLYSIAHGALLSKMTMNIQERTVLSTIGMVVNNVVIMGIGMTALPLVMTLGWGKTAVILGVLAGVLIFIEFLGTRERVAVETKKEEEKIPLKPALKGVLTNRYFFISLIITALTLVMNANSIQSLVYYCNWVLKDPPFIGVLMGVGTIPAILIMFIVPPLAKRFSKRAVVAGSVVLMIAGFFICGFAGTNPALVLIGTVLRYTAASPGFALMMAFGADIVDYNEWKSGYRSVGLLSACGSVGAKVGIGLGSAVTGWILAISGYNGAAQEQTAEALKGIAFSFSWMGLILCIVILIPVLLMDIEKKLPEIQKDLLERHRKAMTQEVKS
jgi:GPH family glycoside/pentoside/hexuronide:cation symporter